MVQSHASLNTDFVFKQLSLSADKSVMHKPRFFFTGKSLKDWNSVLNKVVTSINYDKVNYKNSTELFKAFFTGSSDQEPVVVPQQSTLFKYQPGDTVFVNFSKETRRSFSFKYSLTPGKNVLLETH